MAWCRKNILDSRDLEIVSTNTAMTERDKLILGLRNGGASWKECASTLGVSEGRALEIWRIAVLNEIKSKRWTAGRSERTIYALGQNSINSLEEVKAYLAEHPTSMMVGIGKKGYEALRAWAEKQ